MSSVAFVLIAFLLLKVTPLTSAIAYGRYRSHDAHVEGNKAPAAGYVTGYGSQTEEHQPLPESYRSQKAGYEADIAGYATPTQTQKLPNNVFSTRPKQPEYIMAKAAGRRRIQGHKHVLDSGFNKHKYGDEALERGHQEPQYEGQAEKHGGQLEHSTVKEQWEKEVMEEENEMRRGENKVLNKWVNKPDYTAKYGAHQAGYRAPAEEIREQHKEGLTGMFTHPEHKVTMYGTLARNRAKAAGYNTLRASYGELNKMNEIILAAVSKRLELRARAADYETFKRKQKLQGELQELLAAETRQHGE